jgi:hypothetical protein
MSDTDFERQLAASFETHARGLTVRPRPFQPVRTDLDLGDGDPTAPPSRWPSRSRGPSPARGIGRRRILGSMAAGILAAAVVAAAVVAGGDGEEPVRLSGVPAVPEGALAPDWTGPAGWELSGLDWRAEPGNAGLRLSAPTTAQLLGDPADADTPDAALLVEANAGSSPDGMQPTTVRGTPGLWGPDERDPAQTALLWAEQDVDMRASFRGMTLEQAVAALDGLVVRAGGPEAGFDVPPGGLPTDVPGGLVLLGEATDGSPSTSPPAVLATYGPRRSAAGMDMGALEASAAVRTVARSGGATPAYVTAWHLGGRDGEGVAEWWSPDDGTGQASLVTVRPDGSLVDVAIDPEAAADVNDPEEMARDITSTVGPVTAEQLSDTWSGLVDQWVAQDLLVAVPTDAGTVELRGPADGPVLCLRAGDLLTCEPADHPSLGVLPAEGSEGQWTAVVRTDEGDALLAVSDAGPVLLQDVVEDPDQEDGVGHTYPEAATGEAGGSWASVLTGDVFMVQPITDVATEAEACLAALASPELAGQPEEADRIRDESDDPATRYRACRELTDDSDYTDLQ